MRPVRLLALVWLLMLAACGRPAAGATAGVPAVVPAAPAESPSTATPAAGTRAVVLAIRRDRALHIMDATTLEDLAQVRLHNPANRVGASPDGRMLFITQGATPEGAGCCALFALDLATSSMCRLVEPATEAVPSPDGQHIFTQRGNDGIQVFDGQTLKRLPAIAAPGVYELHPSPDGRRLVGTSYWPELSLDMVHVERGLFERRLVLPVGNTGDHSGVALDGTWLGEQFRLVSRSEAGLQLWTVTPEMTDLSDPVAVTMEAGDRMPVSPDVLAVGNSLGLYQPLGWWFKFDHSAESPGGLFIVEPATGRITAHLWPDITFARIIPGADGAPLFGLDAGAPDGTRPVRLLALDASTGTVLRKRELAADVWSIATARLTEALVPRGIVEPLPCSAIQPTPFPTPVPPPTARPVPTATPAPTD